jgi:hypothetical protein
MSKGERGFGGLILVEILCGMLLTVALLAQAGVSIVKVRQAERFQAARNRCRMIGEAIATEAICLNQPNGGCTPTPALMAIIPSWGTWVSEGYTYTLAGDPTNWSITASPLDDGRQGGMPGNVFISSTDYILRCSNQGPANTGSTPCQ